MMHLFRKMKLRWKMALWAFAIDGVISIAEYLYNYLNPYAFDNEYFDVWVRIWSLPHRPADWLTAYGLMPLYEYLIPQHVGVASIVSGLVAYHLEFAVIFWFLGWWLEKRQSES
jgi:hypothetical protein